MATPLQLQNKLASAAGLAQPLYFKREDLHPLGSHKGRSLPLMIDHYRRAGWKNFCISSSGNAALAAALYVAKLNKKLKEKLNLQIFVGPNIERKKLKLLRAGGRNKYITITQTDNPKQAAFQLDAGGAAKNLRQSTDDIALKGYAYLAGELSKIQNLSAVLVPTSSGTAAQGLYEAFRTMKMNPEIHVVQTMFCHPIAQAVAMEPVAPAPLAPPPSIAGAIVDKVAHRKTEVAEAVRKSQGAGWIPSEQEIKAAVRLVKKTTGLAISPNSALSVAGLMLAIKNNWLFTGPVVCLITGR